VEKRKKILAWIVCFLFWTAAIIAHYTWDPWGFYRKVSPEEAALRLELVEAAESYLGCKEADGSHKTIIDRYNDQEVLPMGYRVTYTDSWCAVFVSVAAMDAGLTQIIPMECGCQRQIGLFQDLGRWEEDDCAIPPPGDLIYYDWDMDTWGEAADWADHVGIVVGTKWPFVKVIEGNRDDQVTTRVLLLGEKTIRGYARPDYAGLVK